MRRSRCWLLRTMRRPQRLFDILHPLGWVLLLAGIVVGVPRAVASMALLVIGWSVAVIDVVVDWSIQQLPEHLREGSPARAGMNRSYGLA